MIYSGGKGTLLWGKYHLLVINDHLWWPSVHVDKSFKKIQAGVRLAHRRTIFLCHLDLEV